MMLQMIERRFGNLLDFGKEYCVLYYCEKAKVLEAKGQLTESEALLRAALVELPPASSSAAEVMQQLGNLLIDTAGRTADALPLLGRVFLFSNQRYGVEHRFSRYDCEELGFSYAEQGRYDNAIHLFQDMVEKLALIHGGDYGKRNALAAELRSWIVSVEEMRADSSELGGINLAAPQILNGLLMERDIN